MVRSSLLSLSACLIAIQAAGCTTTESWRSPNANSSHSANSKSKTADGDADNNNDNDNDPWKHSVDEGRSGLAREEPLDPWFGKYDYASKGRAIERSLQ